MPVPPRSPRPAPLLVLAALVAASAPAAAAELTGVVRFTGGAAPRAAVETVKDRSVCGERVEDESLLVADGRLANAVVTVKGAPAPAPATVVLDQRGCRYRPRVLVAPLGSTLEITNGDPVLHSVHGWAGHVTRFDVVTPGRGVRVPTRLDRPGLVQVRCDVHAWMIAYVLVTQEPAAVTGPDGAFTIRGLPPGTYDVTAWHERLGEQVTRVTVPPEGGARVEMSFGG